MGTQLMTTTDLPRQIGMSVRTVPGPRRAPRALQSLLGVMRPIEARLALRRRYGPVFRTNDSLAGPLIHVGDRDLIEQIFKWKPAEYNVSEPRQVMEPVVGPASILLLDGARHLRMRKLMLPPFHGEAIAHYGELIAEITNREIDRWHAGDTIRTRSVAQTITLEVIIQAVFGITDPQRIDQFRQLLPRLSAINPLVLFVQKDLGPRSPWGRFLRDRERVDELLYEEIARRRDDPAGADILSLLLQARDEDGEPLTDRELRDELITLLLAGHETTATSIGWAFERLLRTPHALERLTTEVRSGNDGGYLDAVIRETLRIRPVVTEVFRAPAQRTELGGFVIDADTQIAASILLVQYDPTLYPDPDTFRPERFLNGAPEGYAWVPFGGGVRRCLGAAFAQLEMKVVISTILARVQLNASRRAAEKARFRGVTLLPHRGGEATVLDIHSR
jgi:cytochrome P450 family 135